MLTLSSLPIFRYSLNLTVQGTTSTGLWLPGLLGPAASTRALRLPDAARRCPSQTQFASLAADAYRHTAPPTSKLFCLPRHSLFMGGTARVQCRSNVRGAAGTLLFLVFDYVLGFVSSTLERRTQLALRYSMVQPILPSDRTGYIYALELAGRCCGNTSPDRMCVPMVRVQTPPSPTSFESRSGDLWTSARVCRSIASDARRPSPSCLDISPSLRRQLQRLECDFVTALNVSFISSSRSSPRSLTRLRVQQFSVPASTVSEPLRSSTYLQLTHLQAARATPKSLFSSACRVNTGAKNGL